MKAFVALATVVALLVGVWLVLRLGRAGNASDATQVPAVNPQRGATLKFSSERPDRQGASDVSKNQPSTPRPSITPSELKLKIDMLRRDLKQAKNDGHRMFILKQVTSNCTRAGSFAQCREVLEGVSDLIVDPSLSRELGEMIETMKKRAGAAEQKSGSRDRILPRPETCPILAA